MKTKFIFLLRPLTLVGAILILVVAAPSHTRAAFVFTLTQSGGNVLVTGSGTINTNGLSLSTQSGPVVPAQFKPSTAFLGAGPTTNTNISYYNGGTYTGPSSFGIGSFVAANSGIGDGVAVVGSSGIYVPQGYVSGTALTDSATFNNATFSSLGFTPGTYVYTWGTGANSDSLTITGVVPEPSTWALLIVGGAILLGLSLRRCPA